MKTSVLYNPWGDRVLRASLPGEDADVWSAEHCPPRGEGRSKRPASVLVRGYEFPFRRGLTRRARIVTAEYVEHLDALDKQIGALTKQRDKMIAEAWRRARPMREADLVRAKREARQKESE